MQVGLRDLHANVQHPDVVEAQLAVVAPEDIQLTLYNIGRVPASGTRPVIASLNFFPMVGINVEHMDIVHPVGAVVAPKVVDLGVDQAPCR